MSFFEYAQALHVPLTEQIIAFLQSKKNGSSTFFHNDVLDKLIAFVPQGKLLRGIAVILSYEMLGKKIDDDVLHIAAAMELAHSSLLIHDDIMDNDFLRRGNSTIFSQYASEAKQRTNNPLFYGQSMGICVGDIGFFLAFELIGKVSQKNSQLISFFAHELQLVGPAQMYDFHYGQVADSPTEEQIREIYRYKTGRYTFSLPLKLGALLAHADTAYMNTLEEFGEHLGIAFQIHDDYLGIFGKEKETGKPVGSDIRENKKTLLREMLFAKLPTNQKTYVKDIYGNAQCTSEDIQYVQELHKKYKVLDVMKKEEDYYIGKARHIVETLKIDTIHKTILHDLITYTVERNK